MAQTQAQAPTPSWPAGLSPANPQLTFEESGIKEQTSAVPGSYWITANGRVWIPADGHQAFADAYLGGQDQAYAAGCVRTAYQATVLALTAADAEAFNQPALEEMAHHRDVTAIIAESYPAGKHVSFSRESLVGSYETLSAHITNMWYLPDIDPRFKWSWRVCAGVDQSKVIEEPLTVDHLTITFHDKLFDYYLGAPNMEPGWYITEIGGMKVGFGSKYQLKKFLLKLKTEFFTDGNLPGSNIKIAPIPEIEEPLVRRMGSVPVIEHGMPPEVKKALEQGAVGPQVWEISEGEIDSNKTLNSRPTGPML